MRCWLGTGSGGMNRRNTGLNTTKQTSLLEKLENESFPTVLEMSYGIIFGIKAGLTCGVFVALEDLFH